MACAYEMLGRLVAEAEPRGLKLGIGDGRSEAERRGAVGMG